MDKLGPGDPQQIGAYRLLARLGAGGMGNVYLARSDRGRTVAVKLVRAELAAQEEFRARFRQEVRAARRVGGHWTAPVLDADTEAAVPWVATGYVAGPSLQQVVGQDHGALPERSVRILAAGLAHALKDIHAAGIVHRDLKPSNVLVTIDGPRVIDFGIARALEQTSVGGEGLTRTGSLVGSPGFMAPEQVRGDRITPACDVFCLGSVLAYAATGVLPFGAANSGVHALMFRIAQEEPDLEGVPEGIADLVRDCLKKDPAARPSLDAILERTGAEDTVTGGRSRDPWLPGALVAQLGRHAVRLLEVEDPQGATAVSAEEPGDIRPTAGPGFPPAPAGPPAPHVRQSPPGAGAGGAQTPSAGVSGRPPEHAPASDGMTLPAAPAGPAPAGDGGGVVHHLPTVAAGQTPPPGAPPAPPGFGVAPGTYGHPHQHAGPPAVAAHPQQPGAGAWGGGQPPYNPYGGGLGSTPPYGPPAYGPSPVGAIQEPDRRSGRSTALLVVIALVVALGAGGTVYALMRNGSGTDAKGGSVTGPASAVASTPPSATSKAPAPTTSAPSASASAQGEIPEVYLGTWETEIDNALGAHPRELTIAQGKVGDTVLRLVADGPTNGGGTYHCVFEARLAEQPGGGGPLEIGPSSVVTGEPASACSPGEATEVTLLSDGKLKRAKRSGGGSLTYTRQ
ncbi:serine/threonine protein kinase [Streptomyces pluripotens]|uniref:Serine/threonine protein kinase n=1 Tax=Streptomyces pluripotens TaxID=1355015 RepID=A0A221NZH1_9ACTN|nr:MULTISPECIES: serine/threonine-protein kinase [Streptomyces]ARP70963.1 serine/threonine protein kinase [Streptomyces pluripotens]ASN25216.1 serine/threonine protein kinase [Streptomyces pluripotens]KIE27662.1 serine/threonine protein kinase [Streptomyces sp. MUSC 125]MCH0559750.1 serine/threonine protein kinase [Streptomyces sp. MUM 16J]